MTDAQQTNIRLSEEVKVDLGPGERAGSAVRRVLKALADEIVSSETGVLEDEDPRQLHRYRIAIRRSRTVLSELKRVFRREDYDRLRPELKWISDLTSPVRDLDVFMMRLDEKDPNEGAPHKVGSVADLIREDRDRAFDLLEAEIRSDQWASFKVEWMAFLGIPEKPEGTDLEDRPILEVASPAIRKAFSRVERRSRALLGGPDMAHAELHKLRIACKKVRYLIEAFGSLYKPEDIEATLTHLRRLQEVLGDYNDAVLQRSRVGRYTGRVLREQASEDVSSYLGSLDDDLVEIIDRRRAEFVDSMTDFVSPENIAQIDRTFSTLGNPEADWEELNRF